MPCLYGMRILTFLFGCRSAVLNLPGGYVAYELGELERIGRAFEALCCHAGEYATAGDRLKVRQISNCTTTKSQPSLQLRAPLG